MPNPYYEQKRLIIALKCLVCYIAIYFFLQPVDGEIRATITEKPNIILILVDDLGYGDIGSYNEEIDFTPNIDRLTKKGMSFTDFHSNGPMCSPTRAALLTGMYQHRLGGRFEAALSEKKNHEGMPLGVLTISDVLRKEGYATGMFGKWHLGYEQPYFPNNFGFDEFRGLLSGDGDHFTHISRWGKKDWWHNSELNMENGYSVELITDDSIEFIEEHKNEAFFIYTAHLAIHFPWQGPEDPPHRKAGKKYGNNKWGIIKNENNVRPHVKGMIEAIDKSVGRIINKLKELELAKETLVIFTSDNGGYTHYYQNEHKFENISNNGPLRGQKGQVYEGGHRVPMIAYWPGKIRAGTETDETAMTMDFFPTLVELTGSGPIKNQKIDGVSLLPVLLKNEHLPERTLFWKIRDDWAIRMGPWKLVNTGDDKQLFNLSNDIGEKRDISSQRPELLKTLVSLYKEWLREVTSYTQKWGK
ncbi:sulfatase-like hydrolase/transferase [Halalkalibaculum sp. DA3122]|uniref:sulfatase-like hydrolase/transferase n=1 Tax=Halalkalibaculum sp. DA3122 TaxID=3373607 RepID=UPI003755413D